MQHSNSNGTYKVVFLCQSTTILNLIERMLYIHSRKMKTIFNSPKMKAQMNFSEHLSVVVRPSLHPSVNFAYVRLNSSREPLGLSTKHGANDLASKDITRQGFWIIEGQIFWYSRRIIHVIYMYVIWHFKTKTQAKKIDHTDHRFFI